MHRRGLSTFRLCRFKIMKEHVLQNEEPSMNYLTINSLVRRLLVLSIVLFSIMGMQAQVDIMDWENSYQTLDDYEEEEEVQELEMSYEELAELAENKIDINNATREDLLRLPFLSPQQVMDIMEYLYHYGSIKSNAELLMIRSLDYKTCQLLSQCIVITNNDDQAKRFPSPSYIARYGKSSLMSSFHVPLYQRKGDKNGYLGYKYKHWTRYEFTCGKWIKAGLMLSQDAGEPFFAGKNKWGYDYVSPYLQIRNLSKLSNLVVGRYRARYGMGLVINNSFSLGKQASLASIGRVSHGLYAHSSRQEGNYLQGIGATIEMAHGLELSTFMSYRKIDATISADDNSITTILKSGYHRTTSEMARRRNASQSLMGANLNYQSNGFHIGLTGYHTAFDKPLHPDTAKLYKRISPWGKQFWNVGADYGYLSNHIAINGEIATNDNKGIATINTINYAVNSQLSVVAIQRFYSYRYYSLMASSFSEGRGVQNENGFFFGFSYKASAHLSLFNYFDYAYFAWPKYLVTGSSNTFDTQQSATWTNKNLEITARYRLKTWNRDNKDANGNKFLDRITQHRIRLRVQNKDKALFLSTQADANIFCQHNTSLGYMISQQVGFRKPSLQIYAFVAYFHTDDYNSRVYTYERSTLYNMSFPMLYGHGVRGGATARIDILPNLMAMAKIGCTYHIDKKQIGSGLQTIYTNCPTDIDLQLRWKF